MQTGFLSLQNKMSPHKPSHRKPQKKPIKRISCKLGASWAKKPRQCGTTPRRCDFTRPRLELGPDYNTSWQGTKPAVLSSFTHSCSQVKSSEDKWINCRQTTTVQIALAGPCTLVTLGATSCTLLLERKFCSANSKRYPKGAVGFLSLQAQQSQSHKQHSRNVVKL